MQFGAKPLFENISVKFGNGNRYGLIGANGCGKSTFMKILGGDLAQTSGTVSIDSDERLGKLRQDQFAFEDYTVLDTVIMGHAELWRVKAERDRIYALPHMSEDDGMKVAELEVDRFAIRPGLATSYMLGREAIRRMRIAAQKELGERFDLKAFHAAALGPGPRPLPVLEADIKAWLESQRPPPPPEE